MLDVVRILFKGARPKLHHQEDHQIASDYFWAKQSRATWGDVRAATEEFEGPLWPIHDHSFHGLNDKVTEALAVDQTSSLLLIRPQQFELVVASESMFQGGSRRRVRATFRFNGIPYNFVVTDPWIEQKFFAKDDGKFDIGSCRICISLPEIIGGASTKLVAAVITPERCDSRDG